MSFGDPANPDLILAAMGEDARASPAASARREDMLCVNPITGTQDGAAPPQDNPGTLVPTRDLQLGDARAAGRSARIATRAC